MLMLRNKIASNIMETKGKLIVIDNCPKARTCAFIVYGPRCSAFTFMPLRAKGKVKFGVCVYGGNRTSAFIHPTDNDALRT